jgi:hypothetical protein
MRGSCERFGECVGNRSIRMDVPDLDLLRRDEFPSEIVLNVDMFRQGGQTGCSRVQETPGCLRMQ